MTMSSMVEIVAQVRTFNRFYTRMIGVLDAGLVGTPYTLTEARVLFELAGAESVEVTELRGRLGLDAGYLSRILTRFEADGLLTRAASATDARCQVARLTPAGREAFAAVDDAQADAVRAMLAPVGEPERLTAAMAAVRRMLDGTPLSGAVVLRAPGPGDLGWIVQRHGALYAAEHGWDATFEALVARIVSGFDATSAGSAAWIAESDGERVGCVLCTPAEEPDTAQLRTLLVEPSARGTGLGRRLVEECLRFARRAGYRRITLWTFDTLTAARRVYVDAGFTLDREEPQHVFGRDLVNQFWSRDL